MRHDRHSTEPIRFRFRRSRARPGVQVADMMRGSRVVATILPTDAGVRLIRHQGRSWSKPRWLGKQPTAVDVEFAPESS